MIYDIAIIGAGITGANLAYELSRYDLNILWLEKENDVSLGATRANSAIIHAGYDPVPGSLMAELNLKGSRKYPELCRKLNAYYERVGSLVLAFNDQDKHAIEALFERGVKNGVEGLQILNRSETIEQEPTVNPDVVASLYAPSAAIVLPWDICLALAEVAVREGVTLKLNAEVTNIQEDEQGDHWTIKTQEGEYSTRYIANAAGHGAEIIHNMVAEPAFTLVPTRGEYYLLDHAVEPKPRRVLFQSPSPITKGVLVTPTVHGNTLIGPNAERIADGENTESSVLGLSEVAQKARKSVQNLRFRENIRNFSGVRANQLIDEFHLDWAAPRFFDLAAIKSPGLASGPAIADYAIEQFAKAGLELQAKEIWDGTREVIHFADLSEEEQADLIEQNPSYGRVICRCQTITEGEILESFQSPIPPQSIDAVKRRTGAGLGRCQGGFCGPRVHELMRKHLGLKAEDVLQDRRGSYVVLGVNRSESSESEDQVEA